MTKCTPEKKRAFSVIARALPQWQAHFVEGPRPASLRTGVLAFSNLPFQLPPHTHWTWNKSSGETKLSFNQNTEISLQKMNAKKRKSCSTATPSYKLWLYSLGEVNQPPHLFGVWCERGLPSSAPTSSDGDPGGEPLTDASGEGVGVLVLPPPILSSIPSSSSPEITPRGPSSPIRDSPFQDTNTEVQLKDFSFLTPYIAPELAFEFGWSGGGSSSH